MIIYNDIYRTHLFTDFLVYGLTIVTTSLTIVANLTITLRMCDSKRHNV